MLTPLVIVGVDLAGPRNASGTGIAWFHSTDVELRFGGFKDGAGDQDILELVLRMAEIDRVCVGVDAPLAYGSTDGRRAADGELRKKLIERGGHPGIVMAPLAPRMVYLTLRGVALARALMTVPAPFGLDVVEVHPGGAFLLRGAPVELVRTFKREIPSRVALVRWLSKAGMPGLPDELSASDHVIAACAAALAAWEWAYRRTQWVYPASSPMEPFDFAC